MFHLRCQVCEFRSADHAGAAFDGVGGACPSVDVAGQTGLAENFDAFVHVRKAHGIEFSDLLSGHEFCEGGVGSQVEYGLRARMAGGKIGSVGARAVDGGPNVFHGEGFEDECVEGGDGFPGDKGCAHGEENGFLSAGGPEQFSQRFSAKPGHMEVGKDDLGAAPISFGQGVECGIAGFIHFQVEAGFCGQKDHDLAAEGVVFDNHQAQRGGGDVLHPIKVTGESRRRKNLLCPGRER